MKHIVFLNRAYNDLDTQLPLIEQFALQDGYKVSVIGYPVDGRIGQPEAHEAIPYIKSLGVSVFSLAECDSAPVVIKTLNKIERLLAACKKFPAEKFLPIKALFSVLHVLTLKLIERALQGDTDWAIQALKNQNADAFIVDEVIMQPGRSALADTYLRNSNIPTYIIRTGHHVYHNFHPSSGKKPEYRKSNARIYFSESKGLGVDTARYFFPEENIISPGNLRMDRPWIEKLHSTILKAPYYPIEKIRSKLPASGIKIVIMLAKMNYGVEEENIKATIKALASLKGVNLAIKPHTRGMKFDFMPRSEIGSATIADDIPSAILCEWADILLFTGSSIAFHAMTLGKHVGYLKYCQRHTTIFDDREGTWNYHSLEQLLDFLNNAISTGTPTMPHPGTNDFLREYVYAGNPNGQTAEKYLETIISDLGAGAPAITAATAGAASK